MIRRPPRSTRTDTRFPYTTLFRSSTVQVWRGPMWAILAGAVESSRVALGAIARKPGWTLPLVISLPRDLDGRHSDFADLSGPARAAGAEFLAQPNTNTTETHVAILSAAAAYAVVNGLATYEGGELHA